MCDQDISEQEKVSATRLLRAPDNQRLVESAAQPLVLLREKRAILVRAVAQLEAKIATAGGKYDAYLASLGPLEAAISARDDQRRAVEQVFQTLYDGLMSLREANETAYLRLREAAKAYKGAGGAGVPGLTRPGFPALRFESPIVAALRRDTPFGEIIMVGDNSGRGLMPFRPDDVEE